MPRIGRRREARQRLQHLHPGPDPLLARAHGPAAPAAEPGSLGPPARLRQRRLRHLPAGLCDEPRPREAHAGVLHRPAWLARPHRVDPRLRILPGVRPVPPRAPQPPCPHHQAAPGAGGQGPRDRCAREPQPVRDLHHDPARGHGPQHLELRRAPGRERSRGREHHDRRGRALVGPRDDHHGRLRRLLSRHDDRAAHRCVRHVRGGRDHRRARKHPR